MTEPPRCLEPNFTAVILAAGLSSRMGRFKPLLTVDGLPALERVIVMFQAAGVNNILVVTGHRAAELEPVVERTGVKSVFNPRYREGMFASIQAGAAEIAPEIQAFFIMPVDIPLVRPSTVTSLLEAYRRDPGGILYPAFQGRRGHPPLIDAVFLPHIMTFGGEGGLRAVLGRFGSLARDVDVPDRFILADMDTPGDYERLQGPPAWSR